MQNLHRFWRQPRIIFRCQVSTIQRFNAVLLHRFISTIWKMATLLYSFSHCHLYYQGYKNNE